MPLENVKGQQTLAELARKFEVNEVMIAIWKSEYLENIGAAFEKIEKSDDSQVKTE